MAPTSTPGIRLIRAVSPIGLASKRRRNSRLSADHDLDAYISLLKLDGTVTLVGATEHSPAVAVFNLLMGRRIFAVSGIGGIAETQETLDFRAAQGNRERHRNDRHPAGQRSRRTPAQERRGSFSSPLRAGMEKYRFVGDMASLQQ